MQHCNKYWINVNKKTNNCFTQIRMLQNARISKIFYTARQPVVFNLQPFIRVK